VTPSSKAVFTLKRRPCGGSMSKRNEERRGKSRKAEVGGSDQIVHLLVLDVRRRHDNKDSTPDLIEAVAARWPVARATRIPTRCDRRRGRSWHRFPGLGGHRARSRM